MRLGGVPMYMVLFGTLLVQIVCAEDLYWEGEEEIKNEFVEYQKQDPAIDHHRHKRGFFDFWATPSSTEAPPDNDETATDDQVDDTVSERKDDESETDGSGLRDKTEPELREKTLRVTFVVMEPYRNGYSNRDSVDFQNLSHSLAEAVNQLFESLPGTQRASLVRIQSRLSDEFSCKVTLDIVTTGYEDTDRIKNNLRDHIRTSRQLGHITVSDADFSANVIDPGSTLNVCVADEIQCSDGQCVPLSARCDRHFDCIDGSDEAGCPNFGDSTEESFDATTPINQVVLQQENLDTSTYYTTRLTPQQDTEFEERSDSKAHGIYYSNNARCSPNNTVLTDADTVERMLQILSEDIDGDKYFVLSLVPLLQALNDDQKFVAKIKTLELFRTLTREKSQTSFT